LATGVYLFKDKSDRVIYVGKAKRLRERVRQYFREGADTRPQVPLIRREARDVEVILTRNEKEALLLENTLIKKHIPRYNVRLRDDKNYLALRLDTKKTYPRLEIRRQIKDDGALYFGPYESAWAARSTLRAINRFFKLRTCSDSEMRRRKRTCLQYQIGRCLGPCVYEVDKREYDDHVNDVRLFLRGRSSSLVDILEARMKKASDEMAFERAALFRDQIDAISKARRSQSVIQDNSTHLDIFGLYREGDSVTVSVLNFREGALCGQRQFDVQVPYISDNDVLREVMNGYYDRNAEFSGFDLPDRIHIGLPIEDATAKEIWLSEAKGKKVTINVAQRGEYKKLVDLADKNARSHFSLKRSGALQVESALLKLKETLGAPRLPKRIECFDISGFMGEHIVASMTTMVDGRLDKNLYRTFKIKGDSRGAKQNDYSAMYEVISRRLKRGIDSANMQRKNSRNGATRRGWELPDMIVVDGGKGQLSAALAALKDTGLSGRDLDKHIHAEKRVESAPYIVSIAKARSNRTDSDGSELPDRIFLPGVKDAIRLRKNTAEIHLLSRLRDEAHDTAIGYYRTLKRRTALKSGLDDIPGVGNVRKKALLKHFGSLSAIQQASIEDLRQAPSMTLKAAESIASYWANSNLSSRKTESRSS